jgi:hypothetical protein
MRVFVAMIVVVFGFVVVIVAFVDMIGGVVGLCRFGIIFDSIDRTQRFAFQVLKRHDFSNGEYRWIYSSGD